MGICTSAQLQEDFTSVVLPSFYDSEPLAPDEIEAANVSWKSILDDTAKGYVAAKSTPGFKHNSAMLYFFESFYERLFDIYPNARAKFKHGLKAQGNHLCSMISMSLKMMKDEETFKKSMHDLTTRHNARGVRSIEYAFACEALFWSFERVCGESYTEVARKAWVKILSKMLKYIIPDSIEYEVSIKHKKTPVDAETQISPENDKTSASLSSH